jgi:EmrB/QacA subfamily drug resistance transporter
VRAPVDHHLRLDSREGRLAIAAAVLGSGIAFLDASVVHAALPAIEAQFGASVSGMQWIVTGYLLTLGSLIVLGGSLGDVFGRRRMFLLGLAGFGVASLACGVAPSLPALVAARLVQGVTAAALTPGSLAIIRASFRAEDRAAAIGLWSGLSGVTTAVGPFAGGWLIDVASWRWIFLLNLPLVVVAMWLGIRAMPESRDDTLAVRRLDVPGACTLSLGLAGVVYGLIEGPSSGWVPWPAGATVVGALTLMAFVRVELRATAPMVPLSMFRVRRFSGANAATFAVYAALGAAAFFLVVHLQQDLGYSALEAGASLIPLTVLMLVGSARAGRFAQRFGARLPMTVGPIVMAAGFVLLMDVDAGSRYVTDVLPGAVVLGFGLTATVAPLTAAVLASVEERRAGVGSAVNNAVARLAGLLAVAVLPATTGATASGRIGDGYRSAMLACVALCLLGAALSFATMRPEPTDAGRDLTDRAR